MRYLKIESKGYLNPKLVPLMGGTTKSENQNMIGRFGTGLKYVLAFLLRKGIKFKIFSGRKEIVVDVKSNNIDDNIFNIITINGQETSITTHMGIDFEPWMVIREIYSNALDQGCAKHSIEENNPKGDIDKTIFYIELIIPFLNVYNNWNKYFVSDITPLYEGNKFKLYAMEGTMRVYKQGILIRTNKDTNSVFKYNIDNADINELREFNGYLRGDIARILFSITDKKIIQYFLEQISNPGDKKLYEEDLDFDHIYDLRNISIWKEAIGDTKFITKEMKKFIQDNKPDLDVSHAIVIPTSLYRFLSKHIDDLTPFNNFNADDDFYEIHDSSLEDKHNKAINILNDIGYFIDPELTFSFGIFSRTTTLAGINIIDKRVNISHKMNNMSMFNYIAMLIEENEHCLTGYLDQSLEFQQHFIDLYTKTLLDKNGIEL